VSTSDAAGLVSFIELKIAMPSKENCYSGNTGELSRCTQEIIIISIL